MLPDHWDIDFLSKSGDKSLLKNAVIDCDRAIEKYTKLKDAAQKRLGELKNCSYIYQITMFYSPWQRGEYQDYPAYYGIVVKRIPVLNKKGIDEFIVKSEECGNYTDALITLNKFKKEYAKNNPIIVDNVPDDKRWKTGDL
jgi:hypothetical protein